MRGASRLAISFGISPLVVGLTVVAYGTSAPELAVSLQSTLTGKADIAVGNIVGSNIFNVLFILGLSALIAPLVVAKQLIRFDVPIMIGVSILALVMGYDGSVGSWEGGALFAGAIIYTTWLIVQSRRQRAAESADNTAASPPTPVAVNILLVLAGLGLLVLGANWLVEGAVAIARAVGVSELIIGLTIVAAGTSLPEIATSVVASIRGERDIAVGNVVGSNIFNLLFVLGGAALFTPSGIVVPASVNGFDMPVMLAVAVACLPIFFHQGSINRWEGGVFFAYYLAYTLYLVLNATQHDMLPLYSDIMMRFVLPITVLTIGVVTFRFARARPT